MSDVSSLIVKLAHQASGSAVNGGYARVGAAHLGVRPPVGVGGAGAAVFSNLSVRDPQLQRLSLSLLRTCLCVLFKYQVHTGRSYNTDSCNSSRV